MPSRPVPPRKIVIGSGTGVQLLLGEAEAVPSDTHPSQPPLNVTCAAKLAPLKFGVNVVMPVAVLLGVNSVNTIGLEMPEVPTLSWFLLLLKFPNPSAFVPSKWSVQVPGLAAFALTSVVALKRNWSMPTGVLVIGGFVVNCTERVVHPTKVVVGQDPTPLNTEPIFTVTTMPANCVVFVCVSSTASEDPADASTASNATTATIAFMNSSPLSDGR
jgi:hypothetical protein